MKGSPLYASISSDRIQTPRTAQASRELSAHVRGWEAGILVEVQRLPLARKSELLSALRFRLYLSGGSHGESRREVEIAELLCREDSGEILSATLAEGSPLAPPPSPPSETPSPILEALRNLLADSEAFGMNESPYSSSLVEARKALSEMKPRRRA